MPSLINFGSFQVNFLRSKHDTKGALDIFELILGPEGKMPVPHYHESWEETVYGLEGTVTYTIAAEQCDIAPGGTVFVPRGVVHGFSNRSGAVAKCLCVLTPGVLGPEYFEELAAEIATGKPNPTVMAGIMKRYGLIPAAA
jgi:mannose-6-phosphate isomerase-like protein (cupin superfamily)